MLFVGASSTKEQILEVACSILERDGESKFRLSSVARKVKIREASIYHYFASRGALLEQAQLKRYRDSYVDAVEPLRSALYFSNEVEQWEAALRKVLEESFSVQGISRRSTRSNVLGIAQTNRRIREQLVVIHRDLFNRMADIVREAQAREWINPRLPTEVVAPMVLGVIAGRSLVELDSDLTFLESWDDVAVQLILDFLSPSHTPRTSRW